ncbi:MAG: GGDEF domain-containing protein [Planctomycetota bacterium]
MLKQVLIIILLVTIPLITILLWLVYCLSTNKAIDFLSTPLVFLAFLNAVYSVGLVIAVFILKDFNKALKTKVVVSDKNQEEFFSQNKMLSSRIDLLSATREISLILTHDVDFQNIVSKSLEVIAHFMPARLDTWSGGPGSSDGKSSDAGGEITIFLKDEISGKLIPQAQRKGNNTIFEEELADSTNPDYALRSAPHSTSGFSERPARLERSGGEPGTGRTIDWHNVNEALEHNRLFFSANGDTIDFTIPLMADHESVGVLKIKTIRSGNQKEEDIRHLQDNLMELARVLALAVKTPMLYNRAVTDSLISLYTKRHFFNELPIYMEISKRYKTDLALVMFDIDHFKNVNDTYGHPAGDMVLKEIASILKQTLRATSTAYRYGGEEIAIILPQTSKTQAETFAERLRRKIENNLFILSTGEEIKITISLGVAEYKPNDGDDFKELISKTDKALYKAKQKGRNQTVVA